MKLNYFTKVEDRYVFKVSTFFWHLLIVIITLGLAASVLTLCWGVFPTFKTKVEQPSYPAKSAYPPIETISLADLNLDAKAPEPVTQIVNIEPQEKPVETKPAYDPGLAAYNVSLIELKKLIPPEKYNWEGSGIYQYPYGETYWRATHNEQYRKWIKTSWGVEDYLNNSYNSCNCQNYTDKKSILDGYISVLTVLQESNRYNALLQLIEFPHRNCATSVLGLKLFPDVIKKFNLKSQTEALGILVRFGRRNINDRDTFFHYISHTIVFYKDTFRYRILNEISLAYYSYFGGSDRSVYPLIDATDYFRNNLLNKLVNKDEAIALNKFYTVYAQKNQLRKQKIEEIEVTYQQAVQNANQNYEIQKTNAETDYLRTKEKKKEYSMKSIGGIAGCIVAIAMVGVFLVFLSIQRILRRMENAMENK